jgi:hypothetical protein
MWSKMMRKKPIWMRYEDMQRKIKHFFLLKQKSFFVWSCEGVMQKSILYPKPKIWFTIKQFLFFWSKKAKPWSEMILNIPFSKHN